MKPLSTIIANTLINFAVSPACHALRLWHYSLHNYVALMPGQCTFSPLAPLMCDYTNVRYFQYACNELNLINFNVVETS